MDSILETMLTLAGDSPSMPAYKTDIMLYTNGLFGRLKNLGVGPKEGFYITGEEETWDDFMEEGPERAAVQSYMTFKIKLMFDPPQNSTVLQSYERLAAEFEWNAQMDAEMAEEDE